MTKRLLVLLVLIGAAAGTACRAHLPGGPEDDAPEAAEPPPDVQLDPDAGQVARLDAAGRVVWSTPLEGYLGRVRPPHLLHDDDRVYVTYDDGVTALDWATGKVRWHTKGPGDRLCLGDGLLLATDCSIGEEVVAHGRWLLARTAATGEEAFRVPLPAKDFDPDPIQEIAGLFLVQRTEDPDGKGDGYLVDRRGKVRHRLNRQVVAGRVQGEDRVFLTSADVVRLSRDDQVRWSVPFPGHKWIAGGGLLELPGGDLLAFLYGEISDSGVEVIRLDPATGKMVWQARCAPLGVMHSEYSHRVRLTVEGRRVNVISRGSGGRFTEVLDLGTGRQVSRTRS
jgi:outer membrane protein assembly factor BamB